MPIVLTSWLLVAFLMAYIYKNERSFREDMIMRQLGVFNTRVITAYDKGYDMTEFMKMLTVFFEDSRFDGVRVSVYEDDDILNGRGPSFYMGYPIDQQFVKDNTDNRSDLDDFDGSVENKSGKLYYFRASKSSDGKVMVYTAMPYTLNLAESLKTLDVTFWVVLVVLLVVTAAVAYIITNGITRNIRMLRDFATNANNAQVRFDETQFPHNELGDISREIVKLYRERSEALAKSQREHNVALHAVEEKARMKRQMTNNINHELKTPVGVIKGYLDTVLANDDMDTEAKRYFLKRAQDNVDRLCNLLSDVSTMTRLEEGSGNIPVTNLDFHDLVFSIDNDFATAGITGSMKFSYDVPLDCIVIGNNNLLTSAISNLIKNAVAHSHGTEMGISLIAQSEKYYTFSFWDNGTGVEDTHIAHLFDRFYRVDSGRSRKTGGTGLGLAILKNIIESLGGSISVHNRPSGGLEFMFTLRKGRL